MNKFERGIDPKEAIGIGIEATIKNYVEQTIEDYIKNRRSLTRYDLVNGIKEMSDFEEVSDVTTFDKQWLLKFRVLDTSKKILRIITIDIRKNNTNDL